MASPPPRIFSPARRLAANARMLGMQARGNAPAYLLDEMIDDVLERLAFLRHPVGRALLVGEHSGRLTVELQAMGAEVVSLQSGEMDEELPYPATGFDLICSLGTLDTINDLPGALIHIRGALSPGGLMIASFVGAGSLPRLRAALLESDGDRPAARIHPLVDVRAGGELLQRTGWKNPVVDSVALTVRFGDLDTLIGDLRSQGLTNVLASSPPPLTRDQRDSARRAFTAQADPDGRVSETFEILTLSGWSPKPLG